MYASRRRRSSSSLIGLALSLALATAGAAPVQARPVSTVTGAVVGTGTLTVVPAATTHRQRDHVHRARLGARPWDGPVRRSRLRGEAQLELRADPRALLQQHDLSL